MPRLILVFSAAVAIYCGTYLVLSFSGGYYDVPDSDGTIRLATNGIELPLTVAILWQPRFGYLSNRRVDLLGKVFRPLIQIDRRWVHKTRYLTDEDFFPWVAALSPNKIHPRFRERFTEARNKPRQQ